MPIEVDWKRVEERSSLRREFVAETERQALGIRKTERGVDLGLLWLLLLVGGAVASLWLFVRL